MPPDFERLPNFDQIPFVSQVELIAMPDVVDAEVAEASATILELGRTRRGTQAKAAGSTKLAENGDQPSLATQDKLACSRPTFLALMASRMARYKTPWTLYARA